MSNSTISPSILQSLVDASDSQTGLVNTSAQTFAGVKTFNASPKIDALNEVTVNNGVQILGRKSGVLIPAGYVGEVQTSRFTSFAKTSDSYQSLTTITLTPGTYIATAQLVYYNSGRTWTSVRAIAAIGASDSTLSFRSHSGYTLVDKQQATPTAFTSDVVNLSNVLVRYDGTNITIGSFSFPGPILHFILFLSSYTGGTANVDGALQVVRIA